MSNRTPLSKSLRFKVLNRDGFKCVYCGRGKGDGVKLHVDHVVPVASGGKDDMDNLVAACQCCNLGKGARNLKDSEPSRHGLTHGLSFSDDGRCMWQFVIEAESGAAVRIMTFSWFTGDDYEAVTVSREFIKSRCELFATHEDFIRAADYWGDMREHVDRINRKFVGVETGDKRDTRWEQCHAGKIHAAA